LYQKLICLIYYEDDNEERLTGRAGRIDSGVENGFYNFGEISEIEREFARHRRMCEKITNLKRRKLAMGRGVDLFEGENDL
jgi:hypothetical protein